MLQRNYEGPETGVNRDGRYGRRGYGDLHSGATLG